MATQSHNLYDEQQINVLRREMGVPVSEAMAAAVEETKDFVVDTTTTVVEGTTKIISFLDRGGAYFALGIIVGMALMVVARAL